MSCGSGGGCSTCEVSENRGCGVSSVFDWLYQIDGPKSESSNFVEVQFKGDRKDFYINNESLDIKHGDILAVEGEKFGHDIGKVTMIGELTALQLVRKGRDITTNPLKNIYRIATENDLIKWKEAINQEDPILEKAKKIIKNFKLEMKLSDVEFQGDNTKATFYYTADKRVDFRELVREYSSQFRLKVEMRQIGARQEAAKLGGIGSCGRELCCSTWMTEFPNVSTSAARYQQLSINPQKISGQCGRLKCCLNFELDGYTEALKEFPKSSKKIVTQEGEAKFVKLDVFKKVMYYFNVNNPTSELIELPVASVQKILELNKNGEIPENFDSYIKTQIESEVSFEDATGQDNINRFDKKKLKKTKKRPERRANFKKNKMKASAKRKSQ
ncbi:regulatory iron-sulfur-containing complex subunit RicT [Flavobacteriales bacterium]|nr:regulatory iron-sulfur-containing complex subunit RicT [Flavobacteriales bacterium]